MEIQKEISKELFEACVPSAKMPDRNDSVFRRLGEQFAVAYDKLLMQVVGQEFEDKVSEGALRDAVLRFVCLQAFAMTVRSLDLVLTATGFGIVSTQSMAPASRARVDALLGDCRLQAVECLHGIIRSMTAVEGWGGTRQARQSVGCLFWHIGALRRFTTMDYTADNWQKACGLALTADAFLRRAISAEYMDELLVKERTASLTNADIIVVEKCNVFTGGFISSYEEEKRPSQIQLDAIVGHLEAYVGSYPAYQQSETYKGRHAGRYENRKEDPTFFFV